MSREKVMARSPYLDHTEAAGHRELNVRRFEQKG